MGTTVRAEQIVLPVAGLGAENPLPPLVGPRAAQQVHNIDELPPEMAAGMEYGHLDSVLPCRSQDGYGRARSEQALPTLVLENDRIRATVLPSLGGRLFSLWHRDSARELLFRNPVLQPANLALRNAWFAGGVEWNLGSTGHTTLTCSPMHAGTVEGPDGSPILRLWEWERTRNLPYQIDFWLPDDSELLYVAARVRNPHDQDVPVYWWSNIAVEQTEDIRVLAPADEAWQFGYEGRLDRVPVLTGERDLTYPARHWHAADYFFDVPTHRQPWIAAVDGTGGGLVHASTARLRGRKLFVWGESAGGRRWQEWLAPGSTNGYLEIQAGLARTQLEHLRLSAGTEWDWLEAYGAIDLDPTVVHSGEWLTATAGVEAALRARLDGQSLETRCEQWRTVADAEPDRTWHTGSGWGALELVRLRRAARTPELPGTPFTLTTLGESQRPWQALLDGDPTDLSADPALPPADTLVAPWWRAMLEAAPPNWAVWYHRGVARWYAGDRTGAVAAWHESVSAVPNAWALRNLAVHASMLGKVGRAAELLADAVRLAPDVEALVIEAVTAAIRADRPAAALALLPAVAREGGRPILLAAQALLASGDARGARALFDEGFEVADLREGETALSDTWFAVRDALGESGELPRRYDFRMTGS